MPAEEDDRASQGCKRIADYALIGDGETAALVSRHGSIDWLCFPRFDSEACMAALLGDKEHGCWRFEFDGGVRRIKRRYRGDSLILETDFICENGKLRLIDFMPIRGKAPDVVRIVECVEGEVGLTSELYLRFDFGRIHPLVRHCSDVRSIAMSGSDGVCLDFDAEINFENRRFTSRLDLRQGDRSCFVLTWFPAHEEVPDRVKPLAALRQAERYWKREIESFSYEGAYRDVVMRSVLTLKGLMHRPSGGHVAAVTSSLPENPGGIRNWDYRYCWLRDAALALLALTRVGLRDEASAWILWLRRAVGGDPIDLRPFYTVLGEPRAIEWEAHWLPGFMNSKPVRFGNRAQEQLQLDTYGEVIDVLHGAAELGLSSATEEADTTLLIRMIVRKLEDIWQRPDSGIWESRGPPRHHVYSKAMCWVAFDRASDWFSERDPDLAHRYKGLASKVRAEVIERGFDESRNTFVRAYDDHSLDAAVLRLPLVGFIHALDDRMLGTVAAIERDLCDRGLVRRYLPDEVDDGLDSSEGAFVAAGFWLAEVYQCQNRGDDARELFERLVARSNDLGLLSEELSFEDDLLLGNFPQALSHLALIAAADRLSGGKGDKSAAGS